MSVLSELREGANDGTGEVQRLQRRIADLEGQLQELSRVVHSLQNAKAQLGEGPRRLVRGYKSDSAGRNRGGIHGMLTRTDYN